MSSSLSDAPALHAGLGSPPIPEWRRAPPRAVYGAALWVFIGVVTTLFSLFITAYVMRLASADATAITMPRQLWLSTACLLLGSLALQRAVAAAQAARSERATRLLWTGGSFALLFLFMQSWAWQALLAQHVTMVGNPVAGFFYVLTTLHGLHVIGGLVGWTLSAQAMHRLSDPAEQAWRIALCARYWHVLLLVWLALYASFTWITPEVARIICRTA